MSYARPEQLPEKQPNLPVREVKIQHTSKPGQMGVLSTNNGGQSSRHMSRFRGLEEVEEDDRWGVESGKGIGKTWRMGGSGVAGRRQYKKQTFVNALTLYLSL